MLYSINSLTTILNESNIQLLNESSTQGISMLEVVAPIGQCDVKGGNGFIYPCEVFREAVEKQFLPIVRKGMAYGELDHPDMSACPRDGSQFCDKRQMDVHLKYVSHRFLDVWWKGNILYGKFQTLPTPAGQIVYNLLKIAKAPVGISLRAMGSVKQLPNGDRIVTAMALKTFDIVSVPSYSVAVAEPVTESLIASTLNKTECLDGSCLIPLAESKGFNKESVIELITKDAISSIIYAI